MRFADREAQWTGRRRIAEWQDDQYVTMEIIGGPTRRALATYAVKSTGDQSCEVTYSVEGEMHPLLLWLTPLIPVAGRRLVRTNLGALKRLIEGAGTSGVPAS